MPKLDETTDGAGTDSDESDASYRTRDAEITDETMGSSSNNSPDTTVPESEPVKAEVNESTVQAEENTGGSINPVRRSCRVQKKNIN